MSRGFQKKYAKLEISVHLYNAGLLLSADTVEGSAQQTAVVLLSPGGVEQEGGLGGRQNPSPNLQTRKLNKLLNLFIEIIIINNYNYLFIIIIKINYPLKLN